MSNFQINDKVVCVDDADNGHGHIRECFSSILVKGTVYVVRAAYASPKDGRPACRLVGIQGDIHPYYQCEMGFLSSRFRKLSDMRAEAASKSRATQPQQPAQEGRVG